MRENNYLIILLLCVLIGLSTTSFADSKFSRDAGRGKLDKIKKQLEENPNLINELEEKNEDVLHYSAKRNNVESLKFLLSKGASVDSSDEDGVTALWYASSNGSTAAAKLLLEHGADPCHADNNKYTPFHMAGAKDAHEILKEFLARKKENGKQLVVNVNLLNKNAETPLHHTLKYDRKGTEKSALLLIKAGADFKLVDQSGYRVIHRAAQSNYPLTIEALIKKGEAPDIVDQQNNTPLYYAIQGEHIDCIKMLLKFGAKVDKKCKAFVEQSDNKEIKNLFKNHK